MQPGTTFTLPRDIDADLDRWLEPFLDVIGRSTRRKMAPLYVRGLLGSGGRKSVQPMAERLGLSSHDQLHHFISSSAWDDAPLWRVLAEQVDQEVGGEGAVLVVDDSGIPKKGELSVGVARQYCGELGKVANSQVLVSLTLARGEVPLPVGLRLFLPSAWTDDPERCDAAGVPEAARTAQSNPRLAIPPSYAWRNLEPASPAIALGEIDRVRAAGLRFACVLADAGFGSSPAFRHGLDERELAWAAGIACTQLVYPTTVKLRAAHTPSGRPAKHPLPNRPPRSAAEMLETRRWPPHHLAQRHQGPAQCPLRRRAGARGGWAAQCRGHPPARRGTLADRRMARQRREEVLPQQPYVDGPPCQRPIAAPPALRSNVGSCIAA
jgi:SRSO17 transposase